MFVNSTGSFRTISAGTQPNGTYWISFLARSSSPGTNWAGVSLFEGGSERLFIGQRNGTSNWGIERSGSGNATFAVGTGSVAFVVAKIVLKTGADDVYLWVNPSLSSAPADASAAQLLATSTFTFDRIRIQHGLGGGQTFEVDELRLGQSFADVAPISPPVPVIAASQTASGTVGQAFSYSITASNSPTSWTLASGSLPSGVTLNATSGVLSGTPGGAGTFSPSFTATNAGGPSSAVAITISISTPLTALQNFRGTQGLASNGSQDTATPAGDGVANLLKYAFNMIGTASGQAASLAIPNSVTLAPTGTAGLPSVGLGTSAPATGRLRITYIRRKAAASPAPGITYSLEFSNDLGLADTWAVNPFANETIVSLDPTFERVTVTDSVTATRRFTRVKVTAP